MKVVILAGGVGSRLTEETQVRPKPMVEIGGKPILWHIMKLYSAYGFDDFVICVGYKGYMIKEYFANYYLHTCDVTFDVARNEMQVLQSSAEPWRVTLVDTGDTTETGGRLKRVLHHVADDEFFFFTYGDGVADVDISQLLEFHRSQATIATVTAVQAPGRFGALELAGDRIAEFREKPVGDGTWINGGFFVLSPRVGDYLEGDDTIWEREPLQRLAADGELSSFKHTGFWQPMDTLREKTQLEQLWADGVARWKVW
ncbi:MAG: glucose-1-phosphate cytidylyltransferase [Gaiellaceae bacterium]